MAFDNTLTITGNVVNDPELRFTPNNLAVCEFRMAWNLRKQNGDDEAMFFNVTCWRSLAENVAESIDKGDRVIVTGRLNWRSWETDAGEKRQVVDIQAEEVGPSLQWASADVTRNERTDSGPSSDQGAPSNASNFPTDEEPF